MTTGPMAKSPVTRASVGSSTSITVTGGDWVPERQRPEEPDVRRETAFGVKMALVHRQCMPRRSSVVMVHTMGTGSCRITKARRDT
jgi:hypothetical protein